MDIRHAHSLNGTFDSNLPSHDQLHSHALIPRGVADYFWDAAYNRRSLENRLLSLFTSWGYGYIMPPTLEYADTFENRYGAAEKRQDIVRFLDHDGHSLALRYDMTVAIARLVGTRLHDAPMPQRFCYVGNIFRHADPQAGQQREFGQAGVELIGANSSDADTEILALTVRGLQAAGLKSFRITLGQLRFFRGLLEELALSASQQQSFIRSIVRRSEPELKQFLSDNYFSSPLQAAIESFLKLNGPDSTETLKRAQSLCLNQAMEDAITNLSEIYSGLTVYGLEEHVHIDLTEVNDLGYYTGIRFMAYAPGIGFSIASGGRYDNLVGSFGPAQPAVGVALGIERMLLALQTAETANLPTLSRHVLVSNTGDSKWVKIVEAWRDAGIKVVVDVNGRNGLELRDAARQKGIPYALNWTEAGFEVYDSKLESDAPFDFITIEESLVYLASRLGQAKYNRQ